MARFDNKVVLVSGGARGQGAAEARLLVAQGAKVVIGDVLETLRGEPETLMARVSGSGATCFALCAGDFEAESLAERIERMRPGWWVRRCRLGSGPTAPARIL